MPWMSSLHTSGHLTDSPSSEHSPSTSIVTDVERKGVVDISDHAVLGPDGEPVNTAIQDGVKKSQATTIVWTRKALLISYGLIFLIFFVNSLQQQTSNNLAAYVTSDFLEHPLLATVGITSTLVSGIIKLPVAKLMDIFGRVYGFVLMLSCAVLGLVLMAASTNVETYAAAQVFYWVGFNGIDFVLDVFIADTSQLKNRAIMIAFSTSPYIGTTFAGPAAAQSFLRTSGWRWGYGTYAIITPIVSLPYLYVFWMNQRLARKQGILVTKRQASGRSWSQSLRHYAVEFDLVGMLILIAGFVLFLLPFSLATSVQDSWASSRIIAMLVIGFSLLLFFPVYERYFATKAFLPFHLLIDRTVLGTCLLAGTVWVSFYCWDIYLNSWLQVVHNVSIRDAGYISNIYSIGSCFIAIPVGFVVRWSGRYKWLAMIAVPWQVLGVGLMIYVRGPAQPLGLVIMCQIFIAFSGGCLVVLWQLAIMAAVGPDNVAVALALQGLFTSVGGAIGSSISGAIWTNTLLPALYRYLPQNAQADAPLIYASIVQALSYEYGSPERDAIIQAYSYSQRLMCIAGVAVLVLTIPWVLMWKDIRVKDFKKPKGSVLI